MDFLNPLCREYLKSLYTQIPENCEDKENYIWTNENVHIWNDMNEPACFNIHDKSMIKTAIH
jgi:alpha 1,3-glucosidase